jgi:hypothetical protein
MTAELKSIQDTLRNLMTVLVEKSQDRLSRPNHLHNASRLPLSASKQSPRARA